MVVQTSANGVRTYIIRGSSTDIADREEAARQTANRGDTTAQAVPGRDVSAGSIHPGNRFSQTDQAVSVRSRYAGSPSTPVANDHSIQTLGSRNEISGSTQNRFPPQSGSRETSSPRYNFYSPPVASAPAGAEAPSYSAPRIEAVSPSRSQPPPNPTPASRPPINSTGNTVYRAPTVSAPSPPSYQPPSGQPVTGGNISHPVSPGAATAAGNVESRGSSGARSGK